MSLTGTAEETLAIVARGSYVAPSGAVVDVRSAIDAAVAGTRLFRPEDVDALPATFHGDATLRVEVTGETTAEAARRLVAVEGEAEVMALNFASAKNPGGGFLRGAKAQEEDLARCSALYTCQITQRGYYEANRASGSMLYTDHMIHSPAVPFFRDERLVLLEAPFHVSILTAPAPNAGEARGREEASRVAEVLDARAGKVLAVAAHRGHRTLVLGAWGCGVFRNDPAQVAAIFDRWLASDRFRGAFGRVVFAVYDRSKSQENRRAFQRRFGPDRAR
ncbi:MAG: TIGR02452 family protein [Polyangiaceae bacterium]